MAENTIQSMHMKTGKYKKFIDGAFPQHGLHLVQELLAHDADGVVAVDFLRSEVAEIDRLVLPFFEAPGR